MKTKNKMIALAEIAIVLCSAFLVATLPAIAADQNQEMQKASASTITTASEDDYVLGVYGNANEDDTIDMGDVVYTKLAIFGKKPKTELCDAKYDGRINVLDVIQTKLIILGKEKELTIVDSRERIVTVKMPVERIVVLGREIVETIRAIKASDKIVGVDDNTIKDSYYLEFSDYPNLGSYRQADVEKILELKPDVVFTGASSSGDASAGKIEELGIPVVRLYCFMPSNYLEEIRQLGYTLGTVESTGEYIDFYQGYLNKIKERVADIPEEEKTKVYMEWRTPYRVRISGTQQWIIIAGGNHIFSDLPATAYVDPEEVIKRDPDIIVRAISGIEGEGYGSDNIAAFKDVRDEIMNCPELAKVKGVKDGRVYIISTKLLFGTRYLIGIAYMAKWYYPDLFEDLDPKEIHQECLTRFHGLDYNVYEHGVFVYHLVEHPEGR